MRRALGWLRRLWHWLFDPDEHRPVRVLQRIEHELAEVHSELLLFERDALMMFTNDLQLLGTILHRLEALERAIGGPAVGGIVTFGAGVDKPLV